MSGAVFTYSNGVMGEDVDHGNFHERRQAHGWPRIVAEDEEARAEWANLAQRETIQDGAHGVLANAEVKISAAVLAVLKIAGAFEGKTSLGGGSEIGGAADEPRDTFCNGVQHFGG